VKSSSVAILAVWGAAVLTALQPGVAAASSVGRYGVNRVAMLDADVDGRPLTFSESDIFACVTRPNEDRARVYRVPYGYVTDQTSIPRQAIAFLLGKEGTRMAVYANAAIVHDYLYASGDATDKESRRLADEVMTELLVAEEVSHFVVFVIDTTFAAARGVGGAADALSSLPGFSTLKPWITRLKGAFGRDDEWKRWANPYTLRQLNAGYRVRLAEDSKPITTLVDCKVFDSTEEGDRQRHLLLHACLHSRWAREARPPLPWPGHPEGRPWPGPRIPLPLADLVDDVESLDPGRLHDCNAFADPLRL
jgi:hypothetical protein